MTTAGIVRTRIRHVRTTPIQHRFGYRSYSWLVDVDDLPTLPGLLRPFARFLARDHLGDPRASIRENLDNYLAEAGVDLGGGRILMLANARVLGYVFNPLSVFWCYHSSGPLECVIAEVHNTYGQRHCYLVRPDKAGNAQVAKRFYVSPFNPVAGSYRLHVPEPTDRLRVTISLTRSGDTPMFTATMSGQVLPAELRTVVRALVAVPLAPLLVAAQIRWQGLRLSARRLPVVPRPEPIAEEAAR